MSKRGIGTASTVVLAALVVALSTGCEKQNAADRQKVSYNSLTRVSSLPVTTVQDTFFFADVRGTDEQEIVVIRPDRVDVYNCEGEASAGFELEGGPYGYGCSFDFDEDGKQEIVVGSSHSGTGEITVLNGTGSEIHSLTLHEMVRGWVKPYAGTDGTIYYISGSDYNIAPKTVGAYQIGKNSPLWEVHLGPAVEQLDFDSSETRLALSTVPLSQERREVRTPYSLPRNQARILSLDTQGSEHISRPVGTPLELPSPYTDGYAAVDSKFVRFDTEEKDKLLVLLQRYSGFYEGRPRIQLHKFDGDTLLGTDFEIEGPKNSSVTAVQRDSSIFVAWDHEGVLQKISAEGEITEELTLSGDTHTARIVEPCRSQTRNSKDALKEVPLIITDGTSLYLVNNELEILWSRGFPGIISNVEWSFSAEGGFKLLVQSDRLYLFEPTANSSGPAPSSLNVYTDPAGLPVSLRCKGMDPLGAPLTARDGHFFEVPSGEVEVSVTTTDDTLITHPITLAPGRHHSLDLREVHRKAEDAKHLKDFSIGVPHGVHRSQAYINTNVIDPPDASDPASGSGAPQPAHKRTTDRSYRLIAGDYLANPAGTDEIFYFSSISGEALLLDDTLQVTRSFSFKDQQSRYNTAPIDYDGDGMLDIMELTDDPLGLRILGGDGKLLLDTHLFPTYDGYNGAFAWTEDQIFLALGSGYMEFPRGVASIDRWSGKPLFFYPSAVKPLSFYYSPIVNSTLFLNIASVSNGVEIEHEDGTLETDLSLFQHIIDLQGDKAPGSGPIKGDSNTGALLHFAYTPGPGKAPRVAQIENKRAGYYEGYPKVKLWDPGKNQFTTTYAGPYNKRVAAPLVYNHSSNRGPRCMIRWKTTPFVDILDADLKFLRRVSLPEGCRGVDVLAVADIYNNGNQTIFVRSENRIIALTEGGDRLYSFEIEQRGPEKAQILYLIPHNIDKRGPKELIIATRTTLFIYKYDGGEAKKL